MKQLTFDMPSRGRRKKMSVNSNATSTLAKISLSMAFVEARSQSQVGSTSRAWGEASRCRKEALIAIINREFGENVRLHNKLHKWFLEIADTKYGNWPVENIELMHKLALTKHALCHACKKFKHMDYYKNS